MYAWTRSKNDQREIPAIASMTMDEKRIPPLKKALPMNKIPVPTKPFKSFKDVSHHS